MTLIFACTKFVWNIYFFFSFRGPCSLLQSWQCLLTWNTLRSTSYICAFLSAMCVVCTFIFGALMGRARASEFVQVSVPSRYVSLCLLSVSTADSFDMFHKLSSPKPYYTHTPELFGNFICSYYRLNGACISFICRTLNPSPNQFIPHFFLFLRWCSLMTTATGDTRNLRTRTLR